MRKVGLIICREIRMFAPPNIGVKQKPGQGGEEVGRASWECGRKAAWHAAVFSMHSDAF